MNIGGHAVNGFKIKDGSIELLRDSGFAIKLPRSLWLIDTISTVNPVTLIEETTIQTVDSVHVDGYLGQFTKDEFKAALTNQLGIEKYIPYQLQSLKLTVLSEPGYIFTLDYRHPEQLDELIIKLEKLTGTVTIIIGDVTLIKKENGAYVTWQREMVALKVTG
jgi:hypothetical protein